MEENQSAECKSAECKGVECDKSREDVPVYRHHDETNLQNNIRTALSKYGVVFRMNTGYFRTKNGATVKCGFPGMSDLLFIGDGYIAWIEVKKPGGRRASKAQQNFIEKMRSRGHKAGVARSVEEAIRIIKEG